MLIEPDVAGDESLAQLQKELQAHPKLLAVIEAAKRGLKTSHDARPFPVNVPEASTSGTATLGLALGAPSWSHTSTLNNSATREDACTDRLPRPVTWTCCSWVASLPEAASHRTPFGDPYASNLAKTYTAEVRADHTSVHFQSAPPMRPIAAVAAKSAAIRPPWRGTFHHATSAAAPHPAVRDHTRYGLHQTRYSQTGIISSAYRAKARPPTGPWRAAHATSHCELGGDIDADTLTRTLGELAAAAAISVMAQGKPKLSPLPCENGANKAWCSGQPNRREVSGLAAGMATMARKNVVCRTSRAAVAKGAASGVGSTRTASAVAAEGISTRPRFKPIGTAAPNSQKLSTAHANRNVPAAAPSVSERPVPESSKDLPGSGMWLASDVRAADFRGAIRDQHASCNSQHDVIVDDRPSAKRFVIATNQRYAALFSASKGCRALLGNGSVAHHKAPATSTTEGSTSARNSDIYVGIDHDPVGVPCQPAPPAFPVLERLLHRRKRLSALLMARCTRAAPSLGSSQLRSDEHTRSAAPSAFVSLLCDTGCLACEQRSVPGQDHTMPGEDRARSAGSMLRPRFIATGFAVGKASARPSDGGDQRQAFDSRSRLRNTEMPGVSAAAVIKGHPAMATDAYTLMRAWRQQRAAAAAIICRAARRYLDAG
ncbi:hypothetical protein VaNZ11_004673 [Volvox africanus]|uniref:Uncharacterized protein n=1 Tax=Volvox africanus TaxID=51714 RepID=A0ABQ5RYG3_9CHLO|nr:hypothetical protein VaNZ11_004673 [Volvox africanus]